MLRQGGFGDSRASGGYSVLLSGEVTLGLSMAFWWLQIIYSTRESSGEESALDAALVVGDVMMLCVYCSVEPRCQFTSRFWFGRRFRFEVPSLWHVGAIRCSSHRAPYCVLCTVCWPMAGCLAAWRSLRAPLPPALLV